MLWRLSPEIRSVKIVVINENRPGITSHIPGLNIFIFQPNLLSKNVPTALENINREKG